MQTNFTRSIGLLILLGVCAAAALLLIPVAAPAPVATQVPVAAPVQAYPPPVGGTPLPTLVYAYPPPGSTQSAAMRVPLCQFQGEATAPEVNDVALEDYVFSEPRVVLTSTGNIELVEWLPDNQRILITEYIPHSNLQFIELFEPLTSEMQIYAVRTRINEPPAWVSTLNAVVYPAINILNIDEVHHRYEFTHQIWVSHGDPENSQLVEDGLSNFFIAVKPDQNQIAYLSNQQLIQRNSMLEVSQSIQLDLTQWEYRRDIYPPADYRMAWQPDNSRIFLYSNGDTGGYTFLFDTDTQQICEVDLGGWAVVARWSPNGRYLAIVRAQGTLPINFSSLTVLDTATGDMHNIDIAPQEIKGQHFVEDIAWAADNHHLIAFGKVLVSIENATNNNVSKHEGLYLIDFATGETTQILPTYHFAAGWWGTNLAWSSDGSKLMAQCTIDGEEQICLIAVHTTNQP